MKTTRDYRINRAKRSAGTYPFIGVNVPFIGFYSPFIPSLIGSHLPFVGLRRHSGVTLIELMTTLAVAAILVAWAIPSFRAYLQNTRVSTQTNEFVAAVNLARSTAITDGVAVTACTSNAANTCGGSWNDGWLMFTDCDNDGVPDLAATATVCDGEPERLVISGVAQSGGTTITETSSATGFRYLSNGFIDNPRTFIVCGQDTDTGRRVVIDATGRPRVDDAAPGDC